MAFKPFPWTCPYCGRPTTLTDPHYDSGEQRLWVKGSEYEGLPGLRYVAVTCPNQECKKLTLVFSLVNGQLDAHVNWKSTGIIQSWNLLPESSAKPQPDYIPKALRNDYIEACRIASLSPKASATTSRRCLQGMIRDFWKKPKQPTLKKEIDAIQGDVDPVTWGAIDAVRKVIRDRGTVGAPLQADGVMDLLGCSVES